MDLVSAEGRSRLLPVHVVKDDPLFPVIGGALLLPPVGFGASILLGGPDWLTIALGIAAIPFALLLCVGLSVLLGMIKEVIVDPWRGFKVRPPRIFSLKGDGLKEELGEAARVIRPTKGRFGHVVRWEHRGRSVILAGRATWAWVHTVFVEVDRELPPLELAHQITQGLPDKNHVEDAEFNRRFKVVVPTPSPASARYANAFFHPTMISYLLSREPQPFQLAGRYLACTVADESPEETLEKAEHLADYLCDVADRIPRHVYAQFGGDPQGRIDPPEPTL